MNFAAKFAGEIRYFNPENEEEGDWKAFIENDISTLICIVLERDLRPVQSRFNELTAQLLAPGGYDEAAFNEMMDLVHALVLECDTWLSRATSEIGFKNLILNGSSAALAGSPACPDQHRKSRRPGAFLLRAEQLQHPPRRLGHRRFRRSGEHSRGHQSCSIPNNTLTQDADKVRYLLDPDSDPGTPANPLLRVFKAFYEEMGRIIAKAPAYLEASLTQYPAHEPHAALFLTFLQLLRIQQDNINDFTQRHLDFYYREVLGLREEPQRPDQVHLIFELARNTHQHILKAGTRFAAGKDASGVSLHYRLDADTVLNKAQVASLRTVFLDTLYQLNPANCQPANRIINVPGRTRRQFRGRPRSTDRNAGA